MQSYTPKYQLLIKRAWKDENFKIFLLYLPHFLFWGYICFALIFLSILVDFGNLMIAIGFSFTIILLFMTGFILIRVRVGEFLVGMTECLIGLLGIIFSTAAEYINGIGIFLLYNGILGVFHIFHAFHWISKSKRGESKLNIDHNILARKQIKVLIFLDLFISVSGWTIPFLIPTTRNFDVSSDTMQNYELVLYWTNKNALSTQLIDICQKYNVTLSVNLYERHFEIGEPDALHCAEIFRYANQRGVKLEVFPIFERENGWYPSYNESSNLLNLYSSFRNWAVRENVSIQYLMWDTEGAYENPTYRGWAEEIGLEAIGQLGTDVKYTNLRKNNWTQAITLWHEVALRAKQDGYILRATVDPYFYDFRDGDQDNEYKMGTPAFSVFNDYEYLSMMVYRSCEWGNNDSAEYVYRAAKDMQNFDHNKTAICIGCLNYAAYLNEESIVNDIRLAVSVGIDSVRLFQGYHWVNGTNNTNAQGYEGLERLLKGARQAGSCKYQTNGLAEIIYEGNLLIDLLFNFI